MEKISNRSFWISFILALAVIWISVTMSVQSAGQSQSAAKSLSPIDPVQLDLIFKELKGKQALIEASKELDDATKKTLLAQVDQAIQFAKLAEHEQLSRKLTEMIERTKKRLDALNKEIESLKGITESGFTEETRQLSLLAEHAKGQAELVLYEQQLTGHGIISSLLTAERDLADRAVAKQDSKVKTWLNLLQERNRAEAAQALEQAEEAKQKATELPPPIFRSSLTPTSQ